MKEGKESHPVQGSRWGVKGEGGGQGPAGGEERSKLEADGMAGACRGSSIGTTACGAARKNGWAVLTERNRQTAVSALAAEQSRAVEYVTWAVEYVTWWRRV